MPPPLERKVQHVKNHRVEGRAAHEVLREVELLRRPGGVERREEELCLLRRHVFHSLVVQTVDVRVDAALVIQLDKPP